MVKHVVEVGDLARLVTNDGEAETAAGDLINIFDPAAMALDGVSGEADELDTALSKFGLEFGEGTEFWVGILSVFLSPTDRTQLI